MLELSHISKTYRTGKGIKVHALKDVNLRFADHGMVFILGKSGSGKSTLLNMIGGLDQADSGELIIHQKSTKQFSQADYDAYRNTYIGFIFQEFCLIEEYTIEKNIALSYQLQQKEADKQQIAQILETVGLKGFENRYPSELSGGQKQRVAIARSLIKQPQILMADEPTGALDSATGKEIFTTLKELSKEKLVIVVSHDEDAAKTYADRVITFSDGEVIDDTNPEAETDQQEFVPIASHLPLKDCFHLGITCFKHKKLRMIFTILLTSFALLCLALSDSVGQFNGADAQYKAMRENDEHLLSIQRHNVDQDGNIYVGWQEHLNEITQANAVKIMNTIPQKTAKLYDSAQYQFTSTTMGINVKERNCYFDLGLDHFYLTEVNDLRDLDYEQKDIIGHFPKSDQELAISSYLAEMIIKYGIHDQQGNLIKPENETELLEKVKLPILDQWISVSAIVKEKDYSEYAFLQSIAQGQMKEEEHRKFRKFYSLVQQNSSYLYVKDGFIDAIQPNKDNYLYKDNYDVTYTTASFQAGTVMYGGNVAYPKTAIAYFDGTQTKETDRLAKDEVLWSVIELANYYQSISSSFPSFYDNAFQKRSAAEKEQTIKEMAKQVIGKKFTMRYESYFSSEIMMEQEVSVKGVILPSDYGMNMLDTLDSTAYFAKALIEPHISDSIYIGAVMTSCSGNECQQLLENYVIDKEYYAKTLASNDVQSVKDFAEFATKVFFVASIAFFVFAAVLMMNFIVVSISYRRKDIGILRSIGARSIDVVKIFIWEAFVLAIISYLVTLVFLYAISFAVNQFAMETVGILISPVIVSMRQPLLLIIIVFLVALISGALPILRIAKQRPIDAIRKG